MHSHTELVSESKIKSHTKRFFASAQNDGDNQTYRHTEALAEVSNKQNSNNRFFASAQNDRICNKAAFTLAEVLITLGIIGIISAITIPMLITKYQKQQTIIRLKGAYSQLNQALRRSTIDNEEVSGWDFSSPNWADKYLIPYLVGTKQHWKDLSASDSIPYKEVSGRRETGLALMRPGFGGTSIYTMLNGVDIFFYDHRPNATTSGWRTDIVVDINGVLTKPNQFGKDAFFFQLWEDGSLLPMGYKTTYECHVPGDFDREFLKKGTCLNYGCNKNGRGMWCAALLMKDGWQILSDYPW